MIDKGVEVGNGLNIFFHLPVLEGKRLVGIISERDLKKILPQKTKKFVRPGGKTYSIDPDNLPHSSLLILRSSAEGNLIGPVRARQIMRSKVLTVRPNDK